MEVAALLQHSFDPCFLQVNTFDPVAINIVLGYHLIDDPNRL
jgi:hypothetical protein